MEPRLLVWVALGGALGAVLRALVSTLMLRVGFPPATLVVNVLGSFVLALVLFHEASRGSLPAGFRAFFAVGFLGAFTTMSAVAHESTVLSAEASTWKGLGYAAMNVSLSVAAAFAGRALAIRAAAPA